MRTNGSQERLCAATGVQFVSVLSDQRENDQRETVFEIGALITFATDANFCDLLQMAIDSANDLYVADDCAGVIFKITLTASSTPLPARASVSTAMDCSRPTLPLYTSALHFLR